MAASIICDAEVWPAVSFIEQASQREFRGDSFEDVS
jgi:hypothetical protein